jgi:hypothetical protein
VDTAVRLPDRFLDRNTIRIQNVLSKAVCVDWIPLKNSCSDSLFDQRQHQHHHVLSAAILDCRRCQPTSTSDFVVGVIAMLLMCLLFAFTIATAMCAYQFGVSKNHNSFLLNTCPVELCSPTGDHCYHRRALLRYFELVDLLVHGHLVHRLLPSRHSPSHCYIRSLSTRVLPFVFTRSPFVSCYWRMCVCVE